MIGLRLSDPTPQTLPAQEAFTDHPWGRTIATLQQLHFHITFTYSQRLVTIKGESAMVFVGERGEWTPIHDSPHFAVGKLMSANSIRLIGP